MSTSHPPVTIPNTEHWTLSSSIVDQEFSVFVGLPCSYASDDRHYPALYVLDANVAFGTVRETVHFLELSGEVPEMVVVGVGYPVGDFLQTLALRTRDLTPTIDDEWYDDEWKSGKPDWPD